MIFVDQSGKSRRVNLNKMVWNKKNCFKNWNCYSGLQTLVIDFEGDIYRGWCKEGGKIGSIYHDFKFPTQPIKCQKEFCDCKFDFQSEKIRKDYRPNV